MALTEDVRQVIAILEEEGYGALAGELMMEINLGRPVEKLRQTGAEDRGEDADTAIVRIPLEGEEQLRDAMAFLRLRLVEPVRAFAEAERLASELSQNGSVRIRFIDPEERFEEAPISTREIGDASVAEKLDNLLQRLPSMTVPPTIDGVS